MEIQNKLDTGQPIKAKDVLEDAKTIVSGDRQKTHGDKLINHGNIGRMWTAYLTNHFGKEIFIRPDMVADMMEAAKIARRQAGDFNPDDYTDGSGYAGISCELRQLIED
tara:strand:- start:1157 stop:1483 length:327 start_codon:yes stop_codon:yes gene_type:complete